MIFLIRLIQNAVSIYSIILVAFALLSWFPNAYESQLGRLVIRLARPVIEPLRKLNLQFAGLDFTVWAALTMTVNRAIYQHFSQDDIPFIDKGLEWIKRVEDTYAPVLTPFINPHQEQILRVLAGTYGLGCQSSGDFLPTESVRVLLYPDYFEPEISDFEMALLEICYPSKFEQLSHGKILGTIINQLGIDRKLFGDILVDEKRAQIFVNRDFIPLFQDGIRKIGRLPVSLEERPFTDRILSKIDYKEREILVSSFRLDALLSSALKLSRNQTSQLIEKKSVQVNYHLVEKSDYQVAVGDLISVRKFGRLKVVKDNGQTKKDKKKLIVRLLLSK